MAVSDIDAIVCETTIAAPPETVFRHFTEADLYTRWMGAHAQLDPRPGGTYALDFDPETRARGTFLEVVPYSRVVFTFGWEGQPDRGAPGASTVEVTLTPTDVGTHVRLVHRGLRNIEARNEHRDGWLLYLGRLQTLLAGGVLDSDPNTSPPAGGGGMQNQ